MGIGGLPLDYTEEEWIEAFEKAEGIVAQVAKLLNVCTKTVHNHLNASLRLQDALKDIRRRYQYKMLDRAETVLGNLMHQEEDLNVAFKSATYTLNNLGRPRGYAFAEVARAVEEKSLADHLLEAQGRATVNSDGKNVSITGPGPE